jgi:hypothetical protein
MKGLGMDKIFFTDCISRIYDWTSIVAHRQYRVSIPILWFISLYTQLELGTIFSKHNNKISPEIDKILEELQRHRDFANMRKQY